MKYLLEAVYVDLTEIQYGSEIRLCPAKHPFYFNIYLTLQLLASFLEDLIPLSLP